MGVMPFIHRFRTSNPDRFFVYDVGTNLILRVEQLVWDILGLFGQMNETEILQELCDSYREEKIFEAFLQIKKFMNKQRVFQGNMIKGLHFPLTEAEMHAFLTTKLSHIILNVTENCNLRCAYCKFGGAYFYERPHRPNNMSEEVARRAVDFLVKNSCEFRGGKLSIGFYGGEPLLRFRLIRSVVEYAKQLCGERVRFAVTTNGTVFTDEIIRFLIKYNFTLMVSIDGPQPAHDRYRLSRQGAKTFETIVRNLSRIKTINPNYYGVRVGFSVVLAPPFDLHEIVQFFARWDLKSEGPIILNLVDPDDTTFYQQFNLREIWAAYKSQSEKLSELFKSRAATVEDDGVCKVLWDVFGKRIMDIHTRQLGLTDGYVFPNGVCLPGFERPLIGTDGTLYICEKMGLNFPVGNIYNGFDMQIIKKLIADYVEISSDCISCWAVRLCKSCYLRAKRGNQLDVERKRMHCQQMLTSLENLLQTYASLLTENPHVLDKLLPVNMQPIKKEVC